MSPPRSASYRKSSPSHERLDRIKSSVSSLTSQLRYDHEQKESLTSTESALVREMCLKNDQNLALEIERRAESDKALKNMFLEGMDRIEGQMSSLRAAVDVLSHRVGVLENELKDEKTVRQHAIHDQAAETEEKLVRINNLLDLERSNRNEIEISLQRLNNVVTSLQEGLRSEESARYSAVQSLTNDLSREAHVREDRERLLESHINDQIALVRSEVREEHQERELSEEEIVRTINEVVRDLREGLRILGT